MLKVLAATMCGLALLYAVGPNQQPAKHTGKSDNAPEPSITILDNSVRQQNQECPEKKAPESTGVRWGDVATWALAVIGGITAYAVFRQVKESAEATIAAKNAAEAAQLNAQAVINAERAWIIAELGLFGETVGVIEGEGYFQSEAPIKCTQVMNVKLTCKNEGKTPAWIDHVRAVLEIVDPNSVRVEPETSKWTHGPMPPIGSGQERSRSLELRCNGHAEDHEFLSISVLVEYRDIFDKKRETWLGYSVSGGQLVRQNGLPHRNRNT